MNFSQYFSEINAGPRSALDGAWILVPDRCELNSQALEFLNNRFEDSPELPNILFLSAPQLAQKVLHAAEQAPLPQLSNSALLHYLWQQETLASEAATSAALPSTPTTTAPSTPTTSLHEHQENLENSKLLRSWGLGFEEWKAVLLDLEKSERADFGLWTERILTHLKLKAFAAQSQSAESPWDYVTQSLEVDASIFAQFPKILLPAVVDLYPLETALLKKFPTLEIVKTNSEASPLPPLPVQALTPQSFVYWSQLARAPGPTELREYGSDVFIPLVSLIDVSVGGTSHALTPLARTLVLWIDYHLNPTAHHALRQSEDSEGILQRFHFSTELIPSAELIKNHLKEHRPDLENEWKHLPNELPLPQLKDWVLYYAQRGFFSAVRAPNPQALPLLPLKALGLVVAPDMRLWGDEIQLKKFCDPDSSEVLSGRVFPGRLTEILESYHYLVPDPSREAKEFERVVCELSAHLSFKSNIRDQAKNIQPAPRIELGSTQPFSYSPSVIEAYYQCPLRFYLSRTLHIERDEDWDSEVLSALGKGKWIHSALEAFFKAPDWSHPGVCIQSYLAQGIEELFAARASAAYKKILLAQGQVYAQVLERHLNQFEKILHNKFPQRVVFTERDIAGTLYGQKIRGKVDRIDVLNPKEVMLWDYKTGSTKGLPLTQIKNGKVQWFYYRELFQSLGPEAKQIYGVDLDVQVVGGGYLNPLEPEKSFLFIDECSPVANLLAELFNASSHPLAILSLKDREEMQSRLSDVLDHVHEGLQSGNFSPRPRTDSLCLHCEQSAICGRLDHREKSA